MTKQPTYTKHSRPSGNQGKTHPNLKHAGYYEPWRVERRRKIQQGLPPLYPELTPHDP